MNFEPLNRRLHITEVVSDYKEKEASVLLPKDIAERVNKSEPESKVYLVLAKAPDVTLAVVPGQFIILSDHLVERDVVRKGVVLTVLENHVKGVVSSFLRGDN